VRRQRLHTLRVGHIVHVALVVAVALGVLVVPLAADGQQAGKVLRIGWLDHTSFEANLSTFAQALGELGWVKGKTFIVDYRGGEGKVERLPGLAAELARLPADVIVAPGIPEALAAKKATGTIPIVILDVADPVGSGLVSSLARPGGNVTGLTNINAELSGKLVALLKEAVPKATRVAVLWEPTDPDRRAIFENLRSAARAVGVTLQSVEVRRHTEIEPGFSTMKRQRAEALIVLGSTMLVPQWIADLALRHRLPLAAIGGPVLPGSAYTWSGGLMSYEQNREAVYARAAALVDRVLKGTKPADLPVEQPTKFEFVINTRTAKALGLTIPPSIRIQAEHVIE
jgi:putative ABC transport system substrate-binding protein